MARVSEVVRETMREVSLENILPSLNVWAVGARDARSETNEFRDKVEKYYNTKVCMVSGVPWDSVRCAHIWPNRANSLLLQHLGLSPGDCANPRNGLLLSYGIESAFDRLQATFLLNKEGHLILRILDEKIADFNHMRYTGSNAKAEVDAKIAKGKPLKPNERGEEKGDPTFRSIDGYKLNVRSKPFRRLLWLHAYCARAQMAHNEWVPVNAMAARVELDYLPVYRQISDENPLSKGAQARQEAQVLLARRQPSKPPSLTSSVNSEFESDLRSHVTALTLTTLATSTSNAHPVHSSPILQSSKDPSTVRSFALPSPAVKTNESAVFSSKAPATTTTDFPPLARPLKQDTSISKTITPIQSNLSLSSTIPVQNDRLKSRQVPLDLCGKCGSLLHRTNDCDFSGRCKMCGINGHRSERCRTWQNS